MKAVVISDIHGNLPALQAVFEDMPKADLYICAGDIVGYYSDVNEVCGILKKIGAFVIRGNHDAYTIGVLQPSEDKREAYKTDWTRHNLSPEYLRWLGTLPIEMSFGWNGRNIKVRHAAPWDEETYLYSDSNDLQKIHLKSHEILLLGHTHCPMQIKCSEGVVINPGSVGQPRDWNPLACYAVVDCISGNVKFHRVPYDVRSFQERLSKLGWDRDMINILSRSR